MGIRHLPVQNHTSTAGPRAPPHQPPCSSTKGRAVHQVVNIDNEIVGILTRKELRTDFRTDLY
jgi:hypothetical protein